ncbi:MAG: hypothetical protein CMG66_05605 [Candidatus Marinimicrobia bacterium]|nr:hypothetical protein [Candidatus Neomarinimicrobiota bacterium]|tara:strand:- start:26926 stop:28599 length:1674 start_codon:yes stop_codon:yes gene_type:complete
MQKHTVLTLLCVSFLLSLEANHIIFNKIVTSPDQAELVSIYNPTNSSIDLSDYYLSDAEYEYSIDQNIIQSSHYYNLPSESNFWSGFSGDFIVRFPLNTIIDSNETIIIALKDQESFHNYYGDYYSEFTVLYLQSDMLDAIDTENTIGASANLDDSYEPLILFKWDGNSNSLIQDVDYFYWGIAIEQQVGPMTYSYGVNKTGVSNYEDDTSFEIQESNILGAHQTGEAYVRKSNIENGESNPIDDLGFLGNGITGHDETSEVFKESWEIVSQAGCTVEQDPNYNPNAIVDDGSCLTGDITHTINDIVSVPTEGWTDADDYEATIMGLIVDYDDIRPSNGPEIIVLQEGTDRIDIVIWDWDVLSSDIGYMVAPGNLSEYVIIAKGTVGVYNGSYQFTVASAGNISLYDVYHVGGKSILNKWYCEGDDKYEQWYDSIEDCNQECFGDCNQITRPSIDPAPYVIIPTLGERLDYNFSFPSNSKVVVRIFDLNGTLVTSLLEKYYELPGSIKRMEDNSDWDGRNHLGQIVSPGTYLMHIETTNILSGQSYYDVAPIVVGVY